MGKTRLDTNQQAPRSLSDHANKRDTGHRSRYELRFLTRWGLYVPDLPNSNRLNVKILNRFAIHFNLLDESREHG